MKIFQKHKKKKMMTLKNDDLKKLLRNLNNKEKYSAFDRDDFDYYVIRDIENLVHEVSEEDYYKPILVKNS